MKGSDFSQSHLLFDTIAADVLVHVDAIAERATAIGGQALCTARVAAAASSLDAYPLAAVAGHDTLEVVAGRLAAFGKHVRAADIERASDGSDQDTADLFTEVSRAIDQHLWFVEAHLQK